MAKPRLVILDTATFGLEHNRAIAGVLASRLEGPDGRALLLDSLAYESEGDVPPDDLWDRYYLKARKALANGQDVVILGEILNGPGQLYAEKLAEKSGAALFGRRIRATIPDGEENDGHPWPWQGFSVVEGGERVASKLYGEICRTLPLTPGTVGRDAYDKRLHIVDIANYDQRQAFIAAVTETMQGDHVIDVSRLYQKISDREEIQMLPGNFQDTRIEKALLEELEGMVSDNLQSGKHVVLVGREMDEPKLSDMLRHVLNSNELQGDLTRIVEGGHAEAEAAPPNMRNLTWPLGRDLNESAGTLARILASDWQPLGLDDLLDMPLADGDSLPPAKADRRRLASPRF